MIETIERKALDLKRKGKSYIGYLNVLITFSSKY
jgi:hypothetical protein